MGIFSKLFRSSNNQVTATKVLICAVGDKFAPLLHSDSTVYSPHYAHCDTAEFDSASDLLGKLAGFDIVHCFCDVTAKGDLKSKTGEALPAAELLNACVAADVKLLLVASNNTPEAYISGFKAKGMPLNLVMTLDRRGELYARWLDALLGKLARGTKLPVAWVELAPQVPGMKHENLPESIFFAGRGNVVFWP